MATVKRTIEQARKIKGKTDWEAVEKLTDDDIQEATKDDTDNHLPTDEELDEFKRPSDEYRKKFQCRKPE